MNRRYFLATTAAVIGLMPQVAQANTGMINFEPGVVKALLTQGETVFVVFATNWCPTCRSQERTITTLRNRNPAYNENITFVRLDWDLYSRSALSKELKIPRRSTLVMLRGTEELGRNVAGTSVGSIQKLLDLGLKAPSSA